MERKLASVQKILSIEPIEGADSIEVATILGWHAVVQKGQFKKGDLCVYFEVDSLLPLENPAWDFLSKDLIKKTFINEQVVSGYRIKTMKLRGQISQGLAMPLEKFPEIENPVEDIDVTELLKVVKYEAPIPVELKGAILGQRPDFVPKTDEVRLQSIPRVLEKYKNVRFLMTEKLDGTSISIYYKDGEFGVCSRKLDLVRNEENSLWKAVLATGIEEKLKERGQNIVLQGELVGEKIQKNPLSIQGHKIYIFNAYDPDKGEYYSYTDYIPLISDLGLSKAPIIDGNFTLPESVDSFVEKITALKSHISPEAMMEGVVVRPWDEIQDRKIGRLSFKVLNPEYLLKHEA